MTAIAVTAESASLDAPVDPRFGRAAGFMIVDPDTWTFVFHANTAAAGMTSGAGIQAVETIVRAGANVLLTGHVGPKALSALKAAGIAIREDHHGGTVRQAVERYTAEQPATTD